MESLQYQMGQQIDKLSDYQDYVSNLKDKARTFSQQLAKSSLPFSNKGDLKFFVEVGRDFKNESLWEDEEELQKKISQKVAPPFVDTVKSLFQDARENNIILGLKDQPIWNEKILPGFDPQTFTHFAYFVLTSRPNPQKAEILILYAYKDYSIKIDDLQVPIVNSIKESATSLRHKLQRRNRQA